MHIPVSESSEYEISSFSESMAKSGLSGGYDPDKWLYVPDYYTEYRYILGTRGENPLICVGINPSTAEPDNLDPTLKSVSRIADGNGFESWVMFNVYAQRATKPEDMDRKLNIELHRENMAAFEYILSNVKYGRPAVWAAWGTIIRMRDYLPECVKDMVSIGSKYNADWFCAGKCSKDGHPHHPLYLRKDEQLRSFDVNAYLENI